MQNNIQLTSTLLMLGNLYTSNYEEIDKIPVAIGIVDVANTELEPLFIYARISIR